MSACALCLLGYHCYNFIPSSCGHTYHAACLSAVLAKLEPGEAPRCFACEEIFHPGWLATLGVTSSSVDLKDMAKHLDLEKQKLVFETQAKDLLTDNPKLVKLWRDKLRKKQLGLTVTYSRAVGASKVRFGEAKRKAQVIELSSNSSPIDCLELHEENVENMDNVKEEDVKFKWPKVAGIAMKKNAKYQAPSPDMSTGRVIT